MMTILSHRCPRCDSKLTVEYKQIQKVMFSTAAPPNFSPEDVLIESQDMEQGWHEWPLNGPYSGIPHSQIDDGQRPGFLSSNTPHFLVSHAALDVMAGLLISSEDERVLLGDFEKRCISDLKHLRLHYTKLEREGAITNSKSSSGFPRHNFEETNLIRDIRRGQGKFIGLTKGEREEELRRRVQKSADRFSNTVIGRDGKGALYNQGLIFVRREGNDCFLEFSPSGSELVSIRNDLLHAAKPTIRNSFQP